MLITEAEFAKDIEKYIMLAEIEDISITRDGEVVAKLTSPHQDKKSNKEEDSTIDKIQRLADADKPKLTDAQKAEVNWYDSNKTYRPPTMRESLV